MGAKPVKVALQDFRIDIHNILAAVTNGTKMVFACNPNNPTGTILSKGELEYLIGNLPEDILPGCG